jgi:hypothetical protein
MSRTFFCNRLDTSTSAPHRSQTVPAIPRLEQLPHEHATRMNEHPHTLSHHARTSSQIAIFVCEPSTANRKRDSDRKRKAGGEDSGGATGRRADGRTGDARDGDEDTRRERAGEERSVMRRGGARAREMDVCARARRSAESWG